MNKYLVKISEQVSASELSIARKSRDEEQKAIKDYSERLTKVKDPELRKTIEHAREEEKDHSNRFIKVIEKSASFSTLF